MVTNNIVLQLNSPLKDVFENIDNEQDCGSYFISTALFLNFFSLSFHNTGNIRASSSS